MTTVGETPVAAVLTPGQLIRRRFVKHRLALVSLFVLAGLYLMAAAAEFVSPHDPLLRDAEYLYAPPQPIGWSWRDGLHTHPLDGHLDPITRKRYYLADEDVAVPLGFFVRGDPYRLWGWIPAKIHLFGVDRSGLAPGTESPPFFLLGADRFGRDLFSRIIHAGRVSLSVGLVAIALSAFAGILVGGVSGYLGGAVDNVIQRTIEIINSFPQLPLWLALAAILPRDWSYLRTYFAITLVLSIFGWTGLARVVRGKILSLREEDYAVAARLLGAGHPRIIFRHLVPGFTSHIIVSLTLAVPGMILGETALSFLGLGLRPPVISWGVMIQDTIHLQVVAEYPWLLLPVFMVIITVLAFNFLGDGLRDAADPYM